MSFWDFLKEFNKTEVMRITVIKKEGDTPKKKKIKTIEGEEVGQIEDKRIIDI